ncbi:TPA: DUF305 domain-containing protein [Legionella pneumophila]|uniref:DUF305 domain-containing protein n=1 Tax=Legionella erythra TaxID=448 RepID=A0A0W0TJ55_LEGER|nr:DUF305 domain-containing protein [Legionella erythra]HAT6349385.1 DUF305 domain-containing protein [Legionella pneumophila]KTC95594.1 hypothetical protein Lery_2153 [Legionella erythra]HAU0381401.1 DUF305 domain-containing protein [Legionella pneumophila]HAU0422398.1 DUF305 domain-containing protein [Legionella pneumophila]HAU0424818.1 DUF305 domain-containing protein [Legionella pneumophila]
MFRKIVIASSIGIILMLPISLWANKPCDCMTNPSGSMTKCQAAMDHMMMDKLGNKDNQYDKRFIDLMIPHHEAALMMAKNALNNATHPELKAMAQQIINAQEKEIEQLKAWRNEWYGQPKKGD